MDRPTSLDEWSALLKERPLPLLKNSREKLQRLDLYNVSMARLSTITLTDPGLTLNILRAAAQRQSKRLQGEILTLDVAAMILGMGSLVELINGMEVLEQQADEQTRELYMQVVSRTYHGAYQAYGMARIRVDTMPEEIFTAAMLQEVGALMVLIHGNHILTREIIDDEALQRENLGCTLKQLSQRLTREWQLSSFIQRSLEDEPAASNPRLHEIRLANSVAQAAERGWNESEMEQLVEEIARHLHIDLQDALAEIQDNALLSAEETPFYGVAPAAATLPNLNTEQQARLQAVLEITALPLTPRRPVPASQPIGNRPPSAPRHTVPPPLAADLKMGRDDDALARLIRELEAMLAGPVQLAKLMTLLKSAFHDALGLNQAFFAMLSQDRKYLVTRYIFGTEQGFRNLRIPVMHGNLFERLLEKPQALWVKEENRKKVIALLPPEFYKLVAVENFFTMTIRVKGRALGVVYGDRRGNDGSLDAVDYDKFRQLCLLLTKGFEQLGR